MNCPSDSMLRAYLDAELDPLEVSALNDHLQSCTACEARRQALSGAALRVASQLASLGTAGDEVEMNPQIAWARFKASLPAPEVRLPFVSRIFARRWRFAWAATLATAVLMLALLFPAGRSFAQRLLATLRVEHVQTVSLDFSPLNNGASGEPIEALAKVLADNAVVTTNEKESFATSRDAATQAAGFSVRLIPSRVDEPSFEVSGVHAFHMTLDRARLQDILEQAGRSDLLLPASLDGATVSVQVPRAVAVKYGACKKGDQMSTDPSSSTPADPCLLLIQAPSPIVNVPSDLNVQQLAEIALQLAGWNAVKAREFCQSVDWKSTLVLPIPRNVESYETVTINGVHGTLMQFANSNVDRPSFALIWIDDGIIYNLIGRGDSTSAVQLASSLQ
jgi:Putative zinc-finger